MAKAKPRRYFSLGVSIVIAFIVELMGKWLTDTSVLTWYPTLTKASWNPPAYLFAPIWTILFILMAIAAWRIYITPKSKARTHALILYAVQLGVNLLWTYFFFYLQSPLLALIDVFVLLILIAWLMGTAWKVSKGATYLLLPYFLWTIYALTLNFAIVMYN